MLHSTADTLAKYCLKELLKPISTAYQQPGTEFPTTPNKIEARDELFTYCNNLSNKEYKKNSHIPIIYQTYQTIFNMLAYT